MYSRATTTITIYRGTVTDDWGDPKDSLTPVATGIRASILEQKIYAKGEITLQPRNLRYARLRVTKGVDLRTNDRILDEKTQDIWTITNISPMQNPVVGQDLRIDLQLVG
jgi:hypothetical protein